VISCSFRHIGGIGPMRERQLWLAGISSWSDVPREGCILSPRLDDKLREGAAASQAALDRGDLDYFARALPQTEHWRMLPQVIDSAGYLDIEAAGEEITVVGVMDRNGVQSYLGKFDGLIERAQQWKAIVTFNGTAFDLPILRRVFPDWQPPLVHIDLKHIYQRLKEKGGLKALEPRAGFHRPPHLARLSGADAVALWHAQKQGDRDALLRLVEYNLHDTFILKPLAQLGYNRMLQRTRMPARPLEVIERGAMLYDVSRAALDALS
jgi:uncharacterized protein YprB with RNaseH-like and TPR domain